MTRHIDLAHLFKSILWFRNQYLILILVQMVIILLAKPAFCQTESSAIHWKWYNDFDVVQAESATTGKLIMLYFSGSDWCKPCIQLTRNIIDTQKFRNFADSIIIPIRIDFPRLKKHQLTKERRKANEVLADRYNPNGVFPYLVFVDSTGLVKATCTYNASTSDDFIVQLQTLLKR